MAASQLGQVINTQPGSSTTITTGKKFDVVHTVVREMPASMAQRWVTQHPNYAAVLTVNDVLVRHTDTSISYDVGNMATVTYTYTPNKTGSGGSSTESPGSMPGFSGGGVDAFYDLEVATEAVSILRFKKYQDIDEAEKRVLGKMIQIGPLDENGNALKNQITSDLGLECATKIENGIISFEAPCYIWRETKSEGGTSAGNVGKISTPPGPIPSVGSGNWLYMGGHGKWADNYLVEVTRIWKSSIYDDPWDSDL